MLFNHARNSSTSNVFRSFSFSGIYPWENCLPEDRHFLMHNDENEEIALTYIEELVRSIRR